MLLSPEAWHLPRPVPTADDPHRLLVRAMYAAADRAADAGTDPRPALRELAALADDPGGLDRAMRGGLVRKSFRRLVLKGGFDEGLHPRDDAGRFVSKDKLQAAKSDPAAATALLARVTRPAERAKRQWKKPRGTVSPFPAPSRRNR